MQGIKGQMRRLVFMFFVVLFLGLQGIAFATISWTTKAPMTTAREVFGIGVVNNKIYVMLTFAAYDWGDKCR